MGLILWLIIFIVSLFFLIKASNYFIDSAEKVGIFIGLPAFVIGIVIVSVGTSLPELISSIFSVTKGVSEIVVANVLGSNIANIFLVLGISALFAKKMHIDYDIINNDLPFFAATAFLLAAMLINGTFSMFEAILCIVVLIFYIVSILHVAKKTKNSEIKKEFKSVEKKGKNIKIFKELGIIIISVIVIYFSARYVIDAIINLSSILNIAKDLIAVSAVALGTSLPELVVSVQAARKGKPELAVGNILGSNIFNAMGVMGISALFGTLIIPSTILTFVLPLMLVGTLLYFFIVQDRKVTYIEGFILVAFYLFFIGFLFGLI